MRGFNGGAMDKLLARARFFLYEKKRYKSAIAVAKKVLLSDKNNDEALFYVAHGLYYMGHLKQSLQYWKRLKKINPTDENLHLNMGACYEDLGNRRLAIQYYKRELKLNPVSGEALYNLGGLCYRARRYRLAAAYLERCYSQKHAIEACVGKLAHSYFKTNQLEKEQILYEEFLQTKPNDTWALNNLGSHLMGQGEYHRALLRLKKAGRIDPKDRLVKKNIRKAERILRKLHATQSA
ncbi:MAG TPA: tetratricopeptide repeat protein [Pseudomonadales bacterium]|nr:tetratricopeptide repeat protein [Pseudomonadales bacterium]